MDENSELEKHQMSLEASQSSRDSTRYPRDSKTPQGGKPHGRGLESRGYRVDFREDCEASRLIGCFSSSGFGSCRKRMRRIRFGCIKKSKMRKYSECTSGRPILTSKSAQNDPGTLIIGIPLKNCARKWPQIVKWLDGCPQNDDFGIFVRSLRTQL